MGIIFDFALLTNFVFLIVRIEIKFLLLKLSMHMDDECLLSDMELHLYNIDSQCYIKNNIVHPCDI